MSVKTNIKDFYGRVIGTVVEENNGDLTSREAGSVGGQMVKKMIESYEKNL